MGFRDDSEATRARADALERENRELRERLDRKEAAPAAPPRRGGGLAFFAGGVLVLAAGGVALVASGSAAALQPVHAVMLGAAVMLACLLVTVGMVKRLLLVAQPNELLVISGRPRRRADGTIVGYRTVRGGRVLRIPFLERVDSLDLTPIALEVTLAGIATRGGAPVTLQVGASVKIASDDPRVGNAVERFLGVARAEIANVARQTIEGEARTAVSGLTAEELEQDPARGAERIAQEAERSLDRLGLELDSLSLLRVQLD